MKVWTAGEQLLATDLNESVAQLGTVAAYLGLSAPSGWLFADGSTASRTTYAQLFALLNPSIGTVTMTAASPVVATKTAHGLLANDSIYFTTTGSLPTLSTSLQALVVGGGGGSGNGNNSEGAGGGGAGGYQYSASLPVSIQAYTVTVGTGGAKANDGVASSFSTLTANGGGRGGNSNSNSANASGSAGGGGTSNGTSGTAAQGNVGGVGNPTSITTGAGGGGSSAAGANAAAGGAGGAGTANTIQTGGSQTYAAGGAGSGAVAGPANTGNGGGASHLAASGSAGGSGVVIIRYTTGSVTATGGTITTVGGDTVHTFTTSGTFTVSAIQQSVLPNTQYYVLASGLTANDFQFSLTKGGAAVGSLGASQSGTHTLWRTMYGVGNGSTTFTLPNLKGGIPIGLNSADTTVNNMGEATLLGIGTPTYNGVVMNYIIKT